MQPPHGSRHNDSPPVYRYRNPGRDERRLLALAVVGTPCAAAVGGGLGGVAAAGLPTSGRKLLQAEFLEGFLVGAALAGGATMLVFVRLLKRRSSLQDEAE